MKIKKSTSICLAVLLTISCNTSKRIILDENSTKVEQAWANYHEAITRTESAFVNSKTYKMDAVHQTGAYELLAMLMAGNMRMIMADPDYPNFRHMENPAVRVGIDNPDNFYRTANIWNPDDKHVYKVWGNRGTTADFLLETFYGPNPEGAIAVLEDEEMVIDKEGNYEVYLSAIKEEYMTNWMKLEKSERNLSLIARANHAEWGKEKHGDIFIELLGKKGIKIPETSDAEFAKRIDNATEILERQGKFWPNFISKLTLLKANKLQKFKTTGEIGILSQKSSLGYWELEDDEALLIKLKEIDAAYCGFQIFNFWGSSPDWRNRQSSLSWGRNGKCQALKSSDGFYYILISNSDPGIQNWIDACGMSKGALVLRLQSLKDINLDYRPESHVMKITDLRNHIPNDVPQFTENQRKDQLAERQQHALDRYTYW